MDDESDSLAVSIKPQIARQATRTDATKGSGRTPSTTLAHQIPWDPFTLVDARPRARQLGNGHSLKAPRAESWQFWAATWFAWVRGKIKEGKNKNGSEAGVNALNLARWWVGSMVDDRIGIGIVERRRTPYAN